MAIPLTSDLEPIREAFSSRTFVLHHHLLVEWEKVRFLTHQLTSTLLEFLNG